MSMSWRYIKSACEQRTWNTELSYGNTVKTPIKEQVFFFGGGGVQADIVLIHWVFSAKSAWKYS